MLEGAGFEVEQLFPFNLLGFFGWLVNGRLLKRARLSAGHLAVYETVALKHNVPKLSLNTQNLLSRQLQPAAPAMRKSQSSDEILQIQDLQICERTPQKLPKQPGGPSEYQLRSVEINLLQKYRSQDIQEILKRHSPMARDPPNRPVGSTESGAGSDEQQMTRFSQDEASSVEGIRNLLNSSTQEFRAARSTLNPSQQTSFYSKSPNEQEGLFTDWAKLGIPQPRDAPRKRSEEHRAQLLPERGTPQSNSQFGTLVSQTQVSNSSVKSQERLSSNASNNYTYNYNQHPYSSATEQQQRRQSSHERKSSQGRKRKNLEIETQKVANSHSNYGADVFDRNDRVAVKHD